MKKKINNLNQTSFYFEDYLETNKKNKITKTANKFQDRIYLLFFFFLSLVLIFSMKITHISMSETMTFNQGSIASKFTLDRRDIVDRNGILISRNVNSSHAVIVPKLIKNKKNFIINLRLNFPYLPIYKIEEKIKKNKYFYLKKRINQFER